MIYLISAFVVVAILGWLFRLYANYWKIEVGYAKRRPRGYIYYFRGTNKLLVKIGRTKNLLSRLRSHRTANPYGIVVLGVVPVYDDVEAEKAIHSMFSVQRVSRRNEWFYLSPLLWIFIRATSDQALTYRTKMALYSQEPERR